MLRALILSAAILGTWLAAGTARTPIAPVAAATSFIKTTGTMLQPGTGGARHPTLSEMRFRCSQPF